MRTRYLLAAASLLAAAGSPLLAQPAPATRPPNIVLILADDLGYGDVGCYGQTEIRTPHIDKLAADGLRFTSAYAGSTVCAPSRCALMTGLHTGHARVRGNARVPLRPEDRTLAEVFHDAGYRTALVGKWGLGEPDTAGAPLRKGFDHFFGYTDQTHAHNSFPTFLWRDDRKITLKNVVPDEGPFGQGVAATRVEFAHDLFDREIASFLESQSKDKPFFLYAAYTAPHANNEARTCEVANLGPYADKSWPEAQKRFAALVTRLDDSVGMIARKLHDRGLDDDTLVLFASDNGPHREGANDPAFFKSSGPLRGIKRDLYEGGIRVPFIARWPRRIAPGTRTDAPIAFWDLLPTFAQLAGRPAPTSLDGVSIVPALEGKPLANRPPLYWEFHERGTTQALRSGKWKLVRPSPGAPVELYDLETDLGETRSLATQHPGLVRDLSAQLDASHTDSADFPVRATPRATRRQTDTQ